MAMNLVSKFKGGMIGSALGDAIGELAFRYRTAADLDAAIDLLDTLIYTDDTAMAVALAESLLAVGDIEAQQLGKTFHTHFEREPWRGYGPGPPTIFAHVTRSRIDYMRAAQALYGGAGSLGNGAAMRIAPVGLFFAGTGELYEKASASAVVTHAHPVGVDGAAVQARAIALAATRTPDQRIDPSPFIDELIAFAQTTEIRGKLEQVRALLSIGERPSTAAVQLGLSVAVHESMPFALYAFLCHSQDYVACLSCAVLNGGDRDTMGAMAGAVSGAYLGIDAIPATWRDKLENRLWIEKLARSLAKRHGVRCVAISH
ncbi:MAG: ADP-ribosylglycohydrolase family protein [Acidiferrobacterales bacterium]